MASWGWIVMVVGLGIFAWAIFAFSIHVMHRQVPERQAAEGDPWDISTPLPLDISREQDSIEAGEAMTAREIEEERRQEQHSPVRKRAATYELVLSGTRSGRPLGVVSDLPRAEVGEVLFFQGGFWQVDLVEPAQSASADGRLIVSQTTNAPDPTAA